MSSSPSTNDYEVIEEIGKGTFGRVCKIRRKRDGKWFVWKEIDFSKMNNKHKEQIVAEVNILHELSNPYIVAYYHRIIANNMIYIIMEFCSGGDLGKLIEKYQRDRASIPEDIIWKIFAQLSIAIQECHNHVETKSKMKKPILHRDLKPANILLDGSGNIKVADFGFAKELGNERAFTSTTLGTPFYMSPELFNGSKYDERCDIWSLGCILYELANLKQLHYDAKSSNDLRDKINNPHKVINVPRHYSNELKTMISELLTLDIYRRPRIEQIVQRTVASDPFTKHIRNGQIAREKFMIEQVNTVIDQYGVREKELIEKYEEKLQQMSNNSANNHNLQQQQQMQQMQAAIELKDKKLSQKEMELRSLEKQLNEREARLKKLQEELQLQQKQQQQATTKRSEAISVVPTTAVTNHANNNSNPYQFPIFDEGITVVDPPANHTRRRTSIMGNSSRTNNPSSATTANPISTVASALTEGVQKAKELLKQANNGATAGVVGTGTTVMTNLNKENILLPPPPPMSINNNMIAANALAKKRPPPVPTNSNVNAMAANTNNNNVVTSNTLFSDESPHKKARYVGIPLQLKSANIVTSSISNPAINIAKPTYMLRGGNITTQPIQLICASAANVTKNTVAAVSINSHNSNLEQQLKDATAML